MYLQRGYRNLLLSWHSSLGFVNILYLAISSYCSLTGRMLSIHARSESTQNIKKYMSDMRSSRRLSVTYPNAFLLENITFPLKGTLFWKLTWLPSASMYF